VRVLVIDDSADVRFMLRILLEDAGMEVQEAGSGAEGLELLLAEDEACGPDAVVVDQRMPLMTGVEVLREMASRGLRMPAILFSAYLHPDLHAEAEGLGAIPIVKSDLAELVDALRGPLSLVA
jgi:CheY-like chemotaxis protein